MAVAVSSRARSFQHAPMLPNRASGLLQRGIEICNTVSRAAADTRASIAVKFALTLPLLFGVTGGTIDYAMLVRQKAMLQSAADAAAKSAALEFTLIDTTKHDISAVTQASVLAMLKADAREASGPIQVVGRADTNPMRVSVVATQAFRGPFGVLGGSSGEIVVKSVAQVLGKPNICVLTLDPDADGAIELLSNAQLTGQNCAVYSNSTASTGIRAKQTALLSATLICSGGGKDGVKGNFNPEPITDCPKFDDPLAGRAAPVVGACTATNLRLVSQSQTLQPGVYCGGLSIAGNSVVTFAPGEYVIKDGPLLVNDTASIAGEDVGFYLTGSNARFEFATDTTISLAAPKSGVMAGLLFQESPSQSTSVTHLIYSDNARKLLGTIYLPRGNLRIDAKKPVADQSAYTAIVARTLRLYSGPNLVLNTNYTQTPVPVPEGIKGIGQPVALVE